MSTQRIERRAARLADSPKRPEAGDLAVLRLLSEQRAIPLDQLARFLALDSTRAERLVARFAECGWVAVAEFLQGQPPWIWLRGGGATEARTGHGKCRRPRISNLRHLRAINEARLRVSSKAPGGTWVCERDLRRRRSTGDGHIPDALFEIGGERHAIEVEISRKSLRALEHIVAEHSARYDAVIYFCSTYVYSFIRRSGLGQRYPNLIVRRLVGEDTDLHCTQGYADDEHPRGRPYRREPEAWEVPILDLLAEQRAIPVDQLARFLGCAEAVAEGITVSLFQAGLVHRARPFAGEPHWAWPSTAGCRYSTTDLQVPRLRLGALQRTRAINEVRLLVTQNQPEARWISARQLLRRSGDRGPRPAAVVEVGDERHVIDVIICPGFDRQALADKLASRCAAYDAVIWFCAPPARAAVKRLLREGHYPKLVLRTIPGYSPPRQPRRGAKHRRRPLVMKPIAPECLPTRAREVIRLALGEQAAIPQVRSAERAANSSFRVETDTGIWKVTQGNGVWKAEEITG